MFLTVIDEIDWTKFLSSIKTTIVCFDRQIILPFNVFRENLHLSNF